MPVTRPTDAQDMSAKSEIVGDVRDGPKTFRDIQSA